MPLEPDLSQESIEAFDASLENAYGLQEINDTLMSDIHEKDKGRLYTVYRCEADEMWSFVGNKQNKQWIWLVMNTENRQIIGYHVGGRGAEDATKLFDKVAAVFRENAVFYTDFWQSYNILEADGHVAAGKEKGFTNHIERFNNTLRQRCSRLVRKTLAFSKKLENHIGAIKYFICHYNKFIAKA